MQNILDTCLTIFHLQTKTRNNALTKPFNTTIMLEKQLFTCSQQELLIVAIMGWKSFKARLKDFSEFKAKYKESTFTDNEKLIAEAELMPNEKARTLLHQALFDDLVKEKPVWLNLFQRQKRYIADAWVGKNIDPYLEAAGQNYYEPASNNNWESLKSMFTAMRNFIVLYKAELMENENMPDSFETKVTEAQTDFKELYEEFLDKKRVAGVLRNARVVKLNLVYSNLISMFKDGQDIFNDNPQERKNFIFDELLKTVSGSGQAGLTGLVKDAVTGFAIPGVTVLIYEKERSATTDAEGRYEMLSVAAGFYQIIVSKKGYETLTVEDHEIKVGTVGRLEVKLTPLVAAVKAVEKEPVSGGNGVLV